MTYAYLHGFASGPESGKATYLRRRFAEKGVDLHVPPLAPEGLETLTVSGQLAIVEALAPDLVIGSSMGGYLAALYAARHPERVQRVVLLAPAFGFPRRWAEELGTEGIGKWEETGYLEVQDYAANRPARVGWGLMKDAQGFAMEPEIVQPCLLFHGRNDETVPVEYSVKYAESRSNVRLRVLESDHQLTDSVDLIWEETRDFLGI